MKKNGLEIIEVNDIELFFRNEKQVMSLDKRLEIDNRWKGIEGCFDGKLVHVERISWSGDKAIIRACIGSYKDFICTDRPDTIDGINEAKDCCIPLSVGAITITGDDKIVIAKRHGTYLNNGKWSFPAEGYMVPGESIEGNLLVETEEELGISAYDGLRIMGIVFEEVTRQPYIAVILETSVSSQSLLDSFNSCPDKEFEEISFIDNEREDFIRFYEGHDLTPHNLGKATLYHSYRGW